MTVYNATELATISKLVDDIGLKKAELAQPLQELEDLKNQLKRYGAGKYSGEYYDAAVSIFPRLSLMKERVIKKLEKLGVRDGKAWCDRNSKSSIVERVEINAKVLVPRNANEPQAPSLAA